MRSLMASWLGFWFALMCGACEPESAPADGPRGDGQGREARKQQDASAPRVGDARIPPPEDDETTDAADAADPAPDAALPPSDESEEAEEQGDGGVALDVDAAGGDAAAVPARDSFERAQRIELGEAPMLVDERSADQVDYFVFRAQAGTFYEITTDDARFSPDNVVAVYDEARELVAENDDGSLWPGDDYDARLVMRAPRDGDYYVRVEDLLTEEDFFSSGFPLLYYQLRVRAISPETNGYVINAPGLVLRNFEEDRELGYRYVTALGQFEGPSAIIDFAGLGEHALIARVHAGGVHGDGSSVADGIVTVSTSDGSRLASIDRAERAEHIRPPIFSSSDHRITLQHEGEVGDNPFYAVDLVLLPDNPSEQRERENGRASGAEAVALSGGDYGRGLLLSRLSPGDVDYFKVEAREGDALTFSCEGESTGSGVRGLLVEVRDASDMKLGDGKEGDDGVLLEWLVTAPGTYYLRLSSETTSSEVVPWVRCAVFVG